MSDQSSDRKIFSLLDVSRSIQKTLSNRYTTPFWVKAEMNKLNHYPHSGHCYPELVEKVQGKITAQMKANLWKKDYLRADQNFRTVLKEPLRDGIKILFLAEINFDPVHGLALRILDIDPAFTLGDLEKEKQETIERLKLGNIFHQNKSLRLPLLPQRIAIVSVESSKGYADFLNVIDGNPWKYRFFHYLFPAILQGDKAAAEITAQLNRIRKLKEHFDVVAIIRGGGGDVGLSCYNDFILAQTICTFPIPVITGIGHSTNETVSELVSFENAITPTKLAEFLIQHFHNFSVPVQEAEKKIADYARNLFNEKKSTLLALGKLFRSVTENILLRNRNQTQRFGIALQQQIGFRFHQERGYLGQLKINLARNSRELTTICQEQLGNISSEIRKESLYVVKQNRLLLTQYNEKLRYQVDQQVRQIALSLSTIEKNVDNMNPANVLRRGYSITRINGKAISRSEQVKAGEELHTTLFSGNIISIVQSTEKPDADE